MTSRSKVGALLAAMAVCALAACSPDHGGADPGPASSAPSSTPAAPLGAAPSDNGAPASPTDSGTGVAAGPTSPITIYTVAGTFVAADKGFPADVARAVDQHAYVWQPIDYPASAFPMSKSVDKGVAAIVDFINSRPGKFVLVGYSQGGIVVSKVYDLLRTGSLQGRRADLVAGVTFGNPMREAGHTIPGGTEPGGHGIMADRLVGTESLWWDFCNPNDIACTIDDSLSGQDKTAIFDILMTSYTGQGDIVPLVEGSLTHPKTALAQFSALTQVVLDGLGFARGSLTHNNPHGIYDRTTPIDGDTTTALDLAVEYLNDVATK